MLQDLRARTVHLAKEMGRGIIINCYHLGRAVKETEDYARRTGEEHSRQREAHEQRPGGLMCLAFGATVRTLVWRIPKGQVSKLVDEYGKVHQLQCLECGPSRGAVFNVESRGQVCSPLHAFTF